MKLFERLRRSWLPQSGADHPLTERERNEALPLTASEEAARIETEFVGDDFDPDARRE